MDPSLVPLPSLRSGLTRPSRGVVRSGGLLLAATLAVVGCGGESAESALDGAEEEAPQLQATDQDVPRTADPFERGYTEADFPRVQEVAPDVYTYEQLRSAGDELFTTVSLFVVTSEGVLVADGQGSREETERLLAHIGEVTDEPVTHLVIGSDHGDHTAGNAAFSSEVEVYAHPTSAANLEAMAADRPDDADPFPMATVLVDDGQVLELGGTTVEILFLGRAHTGGDLAVHLPEESVLFLSEAYLNRVFPAMRSAYPSEWVEMLDAALAMDVETYVPGHGFVESPEILEEELRTYRDAVATVVQEATRLHEMGLSLEEAQAQADMGELEDWSLVSSQKPRAIQQVYAELNGELPEG